MRSFVNIATSLLAATTTVFAQGSGFIGLPGNHSTDVREYVVTFMRNETIPKGINDYMDMMRLNGSDAIVWESSNPYVTIFVLKMCEDHAKAFMDLAEVNIVEEKAQIDSYAVQKEGAPWGLQRISSDVGASGSPQGQDFTYAFNDTSLGQGVDIYILDTGVRTSHAVFTGRGTQAFTSTGSNTDGDGHGTHVAGTAGGAKFGVAQGANIIAVKVLGDDGSGSSADTIAGMDFVMKQHQARKSQPGFKGSIMNMSWGLQGQAKSVEDVISAASSAGIHVSVAAGNDGTDACGSTPARLGGSNSNVVTVGAVNIQNQISRFSNVGSCVDLFAPGEQIVSAWSTGDNIINFLSGTSMACPHTTGVMAYLIGENPATLGQNPAALKQQLLATARANKVGGQLQGSPNKLLSNGESGTAQRLVKNYVVPDHSFGGSAARAAAEVARDLVVDARFQLHSRDSPLRF